MTPRKTILRELSKTYEQTGGSSYTRPATISGFQKQPDKFQQAVNQLLQDRLVEGRKDADGHMAIAINSHKMKEVKKELRPLWAHPAVWALLLLAVVAAGAGLVV